MAETEGGTAPSEQPQVSSSTAGPEDARSDARTEATEERASKGGEARTEATEVRASKGGEARTEATEVRVSKGGEARTEATEERASKGGEARTEATEVRASKGGEARTEATEVRASKRGEARTEATEERAPAERFGSVSVVPSPEQFKLRRFFVLRPGTLNQAIRDIEALVDKEVDGSVQSIWLMAEVDHWNNEKERVVLITDESLLVFKYDFVMFNCDQFHRIPLNFVDRISHGTFTFPKHSLLQREGEGVRVFWDRLREPSFTSRWNPFATDMPFITFTYHPVRKIDDTFSSLCDIQKFREQLKDAAQKVHTRKPVPGKANGVLVLNQPILIEAYVGVMSFLGNQNKLGYCMARGNIGF